MNDNIASLRCFFLCSFSRLTASLARCVLLEHGGHDFFHLGGDTSDLVLVGSTLKSGEDGLVDAGLEVAFVLLEEDHTGTGSAERLVGGRGDDISVPVVGEES